MSNTKIVMEYTLKESDSSVSLYVEEEHNDLSKLELAKIYKNKIIKEILKDMTAVVTIDNSVETWSLSDGSWDSKSITKLGTS